MKYQLITPSIHIIGFGMLLAIINKRQKMSNKEVLLEQAAISAAGLQQSHILGIFALLILIITMFALLGLKKITWALLLMLNIVLFAYLMKLTVDGSGKSALVLFYDVNLCVPYESLRSECFIWPLCIFI